MDRMKSLSAWASRSQALPYLALFGGAVAMGFSAIFVKLANAPGLINGFYRMLFALLLMGLPFAAEVRRNQPFSRKHLALAALSGLCFAGDLATWNTGALMTTAANATFLGNTSTLWVALGALLLFRQKLRRPFWGGLLLTLAGASLIVLQDFLKNPTFGAGSLLSLTAGAFYGAYFLVTQRAREGLTALTAWWVSALTCMLTLLMLSLLTAQPLTGYTWQTYAIIFALALTTQVIGYVAVSYALGHVPASVASPSMLAQPVATMLLAVPILGQPITWVQVAGGALVLGGIYIVNRYGQ